MSLFDAGMSDFDSGEQAGAFGLFLIGTGHLTIFAWADLHDAFESAGEGK